ncbi:polymorphic toxin-type HINT domain-containing protein [Actinoplanes xinjiangensis]|uniref:polymorphic toxin-type HINT domain-containing protein n=1 Tax=Actinoplanes xinjiangensis TaxID=512350 RepID=UPI00342E99D3
MLADLKELVGENEEAILDMLQFVLMGCGLAPVVGEGCDVADAGISFAETTGSADYWDSAQPFPVLVISAPVSRVGRIPISSHGVKEMIDKLRRKGRCPSSFVPGTRVLLADDRSEEIEELQVGSSVLATDPILGRTDARTVTATITSFGTKKIVDLEVENGGGSTISATDVHPFWVPSRKAWIPAKDLSVGTELVDNNGAVVRIARMEERTEITRVHNLTVADVHTYYVLFGDIPILVHNCDLDELANSIGDAARQIPRGGGRLRHIAAEINRRGLSQLEVAKVADAAAIRGLDESGGLMRAPSGNIIVLPSRTNVKAWFEVTPDGQVVERRGVIGFDDSADLNMFDLVDL